MKTRFTIKSLLCAILAAVMLLFCGCNAEIHVYEDQDDDYWYFMWELRLSTALDSKFNGSAAFSDSHNAKWTIDSWLNDYFAVLSEDYRFEYRYDGKYNDENAKQANYRFYINVPKATTSEELSGALTLSGTTDVHTNLFIRSISVVRDDRFNWWISEYEQVRKRYDEGEAELGDFQSIMGILLFGCRNLYPQYTNPAETPDIADSSFFYDSQLGYWCKNVLPGFSDAFEAVEMDEYTELILKNFWYASKKMSVAYDNKWSIEDDNNHVYYEFDKSVGDGSTDIEYTYYRADPTGWYIVAILLGGAAVGVCFWVAHLNKRRKSKQPPVKVQDDFPYDPFSDFFGGGENQGGGNENHNIDPFA